MAFAMSPPGKAAKKVREGQKPSQAPDRPSREREDEHKHKHDKAGSQVKIIQVLADHPESEGDQVKYQESVEDECDHVPEQEMEQERREKNNRDDCDYLDNYHNGFLAWKV